MKYRITFDHTKLTGTVTDMVFPITGRDLPAQFWSDVQADGSNILVTGAAGAVLKRQVAYINTVTEVLELYVRIPSLSHVTDTVIYVKCTEETYTDDADTWPTAWKFASPMADYNSGTQIKDFSQYANHGTKGAGAAAPTEVAGVVGMAQEFRQADNTVVTIGNVSELNFERTDAFSIMFLINPATLGTNERAIIHKEHNTLQYEGWILLHRASRLELWLISNYGTGNYIRSVSNNALVAETLQSITVTYDGSSSGAGIHYYKNGAEIGTYSVPINNLSATIQTAYNAQIGYRDSGRDVDAILDEPLVYLGVFSPDEIAALDAALRGTETFYTVDEVVEPERGIIRVDAIGLLAQLERERVRDYSATDKAVNTIVTELLALQENPNPITAGTIDYTTALSIDIAADTILGALKRIQESVGGHIYVDSSKALQWRTSIGSDIGQQLRFGKNLVNIRRTRDWTDYASRLYAFGAGSGETQVRLGKGQSITQPLVEADMAEVYYYPDAYNPEWRFRLGGYTQSRWLVGWPYTTVKRAGAACRFPGINIPQGVTILSAKLVLTPHGTPGSGSDAHGYIYAENVDNAGQLSTYSDYDTRRASYTTKVDVDLVTWSLYSPVEIGVTAAVQAIVNRVGWSSGNAMLFWLEDHDNRSPQYNYRSACTVEHATQSYRPTLVIEFEESGAVDYVENKTSETEHGFAVDEIRDVAITDPATLFEWAVQQLGIRSYPVVSYRGLLADLERYGLTAADNVALGNRVRVIDEAINLDATTSITRLTRNLTNRMDVQVELANRARTVLDKVDFARDPRWRQHFY